MNLRSHSDLFPTIHYRIATTPSTNALAKQLLPLWPKHSFVMISSDHQTQGVGTQGKSWQSLPGDLTCSYCFFLRSREVDLSLLFSLGAEAVIDVLHALQICHVELKWPNDVLVRKKKIAGILCETIPLQENRLGVIIGIGCNVVGSEAAMGCINQPATSIMLETQDEVPTLEQLLTDVGDHLKQKIIRNLYPLLHQATHITKPSP